MEPRIPNQVELPFKVAMDIVMQGIRIRFGRSLVTVFGVLLGIMFLMSTFTTFLIKRGVAEEDRLRLAAKQMANFLESEMGSIRDRSVAIAQVGPLSEEESRFVELLIRQGAASLDWVGPEPPPAPLASMPAVRQTTAKEAAAGAKAVLVLGGDALPLDMHNELVAGAFERPVAFTRAVKTTPPGDIPLHFVALSGKLSEEELNRQAREQQTARYRLVWIVAIALLVTVMGIANAILMSVTERFREIGTMKCLGASSRFIRRVFLIESSLIGAVGGFGGAILGAVFSVVFHSVVYGFGLVFASLPIGMIALCLAGSIGVGVLLSVLAAIYPAGVASAMVPATALRSNI